MQTRAVEHIWLCVSGSAADAWSPRPLSNFTVCFFFFFLTFSLDVFSLSCLLFSEITPPPPPLYFPTLIFLCCLNSAGSVWGWVEFSAVVRPCVPRRDIHPPALQLEIFMSLVLLRDLDNLFSAGSRAECLSVCTCRYIMLVDRILQVSKHTHVKTFKPWAHTHTHTQTHTYTPPPPPPTVPPVYSVLVKLLSQCACAVCIHLVNATICSYFVFILCCVTSDCDTHTDGIAPAVVFHVVCEWLL